MRNQSLTTDKAEDPFIAISVNVFPNQSLSEEGPTPKYYLFDSMS